MHGETSRTEQVVLCLAEDAVDEGDPFPGLDALPDHLRVSAVSAWTRNRQLYVFSGKSTCPLHYVYDVR